jgi:ABC-type lipoprotein export system ATPase subunit
MIATKDLHFQFSAEQQFYFPDINCEQGSHWLVLGQSGCGKTTLLHLLGGLLRPNRGQIIVQNKNLLTLNEEQLDHFRGAHIGVIF